MTLDRLTALVGEPLVGLRAFRSRRSTVALAAAIEGAGARCFVIDLRAVESKAGAIKAWRVGLGAPDSVGANWDALEEALRDLSWARGDRYVVVVRGGARLEAADPRAWSTMLDVARSAADFWSRQGPPMLVLLRLGRFGISGGSLA